MTSLTEIWNASLEQREERPNAPRDHLWASELGLAPVDIWLRLKGEPPTNPPNARSLRKFEASNIFEWMVRLILQRCGILVSTQERCEHQYEGLLKVAGKLDFRVGVEETNYQDSTQKLNSLDLPESFLRAGLALRDWWTANTLEARIIELKSCSGRMFNQFEKKKTASRNHRIQLFHYLKSLNIDQGELAYISRDDCRILSVPVAKSSLIIEDDYRWHIAEITNYVNDGRQPPIEKCVTWDPDVGKFTANWQVKYSGYLTRLYGFKDQMEFENLYNPVVLRWNRVMTRVKNGDKMTPKNTVALEEIATSGFDHKALLADFEAETEEEN